MFKENEKCRHAQQQTTMALADSDYERIPKRIPGFLTPVKKRGYISEGNKKYNEKTSKNRIIVEN